MRGAGLVNRGCRRVVVLAKAEAIQPGVMARVMADDAVCE